MIQSVFGGRNNVGRRREIRLANLEVHHLLALRLKRPRANQHVKCALIPQPGHAAGKPQLSHCDGH
jgi:hypothetical protein